MSEPARRAEARFRYGDYMTWPEGERWELIEGVPFDMTPAPSVEHQRVLIQMAAEIVNFLRGKPCEVFAAPFDVRLPEAKERDEDVASVVQPDIVVVCDPKKLDNKGCRGAPDFVVEILSPSTAAKDVIQKKALYERHGVKEYWLVHPVDRLVTVYLLGDDGLYGTSRILEAKGRIGVATLPGLEIDFDSVFAPFATKRS